MTKTVNKTLSGGSGEGVVGGLKYGGCLKGGGCPKGGRCLRVGRYRAVGGVCSEAQCIMGNGHMGPPCPSPVDRMTDTHDSKHYLPTTLLAGGR